MFPTLKLTVDRNASWWRCNESAAYHEIVLMV